MSYIIFKIKAIYKIMKKSILLFWGFLVTVIVLFIVLSFFLKVPNTIDGEGVLMNNDVIEYVSPKEGVVEFVQPDNSKVLRGQVLWVFEPLEQVQQTDSLLSNLSSVTIFDHNAFKNLLQKLAIVDAGRLGAVSLPYVDFLTHLQTYVKFHNDNPSARELNTATNEINSINRTILFDTDVVTGTNERLTLAKNALEQDSILFNQRLITSEQWSNSKQNFLQAKNNYATTLKALDIQKKMKSNFIEQKEKVHTTMGLDESRLFNNVVEKYVQLLNFISEWQKVNVIKAPFNGTIKYYRFWNQKDFVQKNEKLFVFANKENVKEIEVKINIQGAGKIKVGQKCLIELKEYPAKDYGLMQGSVSGIISLKHQEQDKNYSTYIKIIITEDGLTNYGHLITTNYSMPVHTQIILDNERLFNKIFKTVEQNFKTKY
ncbi:hypothetical protein AR687_16515 [Flavobacteriaceae bacterium CRH]|nr:hypothetical protein AR687_16515 [Flavobacteriaceae bacterium CRH]